jgi:hypothetical protein
VERGRRHQQLARVQRLRPQEGPRFRLAQKANPSAHHRAQNRRLRARSRRRPHRQQAYRLHHLNEPNNGQEVTADDLSPERQRVLQALLSGHRGNLSVRRRHRLNRASRKGAGLPQPRNPDRLVVRPTRQSKGAVKLSELSVAGHHHQPVPVSVPVKVAVAQNEKSRPASDNLVRHLVVQGLARREAEKSVGNLAPINPQPRHLPVRVRAKREAEESEGKAPMVNLAGSQKPDGQPRLRKGRGNR